MSINPNTLNVTAENIALYEPLKLGQRARYITKVMPDIPPEHDPIGYDAVGSSVHIAKPFITMTQNHGNGRPKLYVTDTSTGQRVAIIALPETPVPKRVLRVSKEFNETHHGNMVYFNNSVLILNQFDFPSDGINHPTAVGNKLPPAINVKITADQVDNFMIYYVHNGVALLVERGLTNKVEDLMKYEGGDVVDNRLIRAAIAELAKLKSEYPTVFGWI